MFWQTSKHLNVDRVFKLKFVYNSLFYPTCLSHDNHHNIFKRARKMLKIYVTMSTLTDTAQPILYSLINIQEYSRKIEHVRKS